MGTVVYIEPLPKALTGATKAIQIFGEKRDLAGRQMRLFSRALGRLPSERAMLGDDYIVFKALLDQRILDRLQRLLDTEAAIFKLLFGNVWQAYLTILSRPADAGRSGGRGAAIDRPPLPGLVYRKI
jgi:hypothetical protein